MKVAFVNTSASTGGAAVACERIRQAVELQGVQTSLVTRPDTWWSKFCFLWERGVIWLANCLSKKNLFALSIANVGTDISEYKEIQEADIIHLHWINQGFLSLRGLEKLMNLGKPVVWTMHDMWPVTGICHHANDCTMYQNHCNHCPKIKIDLSHCVFAKKQQVYQNVSFVGCSRWITDLASQSGLSQRFKTFSIPNPIDTNVFAPQSTAQLESLGLPQDKYFILLGAVNMSDKQKGIDYIIQIDDKLASRTDIAFLIMGGRSSELSSKLQHPVYELGYVTNDKKKVAIYNAATVFVTPSLAENLPNMIMEAMSCGTPCVGFNVGGIPEMIDHKQNGYVARYKDTEDIARGVEYAITNADKLGACARQKVLRTYHQQVVAQQYIDLYNSLLQ